VANLSNWDVLLRLLLAALVGGAIGFERETDGQDAGLRTHLMLALGAAVFGVVSVGAWDHFQTQTQNSIYRVDVTRVASYVAAGIGFVGGGAIVKNAGAVRGLTTAASLWVAGAVGLAAGVGFWLPAVAGTVIGFVSLALRRPMRRAIEFVSARRASQMTVVVSRDADVGRVIDAVRAMVIAPKQIVLGDGEDDNVVEIAVRFSPRDRDAIESALRELAKVEDIRAISVQ
jgi:putative Mg2+ transporter-C (MgtC) family protein